jgi:DNA sulfur modification protein DndE
MVLGVTDISNSQYHTTRAADAQCAEVLQRLGYKHRYFAARLAIARSLGQTDQPGNAEREESDDDATPIRGVQLFGDGSSPLAWLALITQHCGRADLSRKDFQKLVSAHWRRGAELLSRDWDEANANLSAFVARLADLAQLEGTGATASRPWAEPFSDYTGALSLPVGPVAEDRDTGEPVVFQVNAPGGSPHVAIMGGTNSGKTYTAVTMVRRLHAVGTVPVLAFDFKGDLSEKLAPHIAAEITTPPRSSVPLNVLAVATPDDTGMREAAGRIRDSIGRIKNSKLSGIQSDALREAIFHVLQRQTKERPATLADVSRALIAEYRRLGRAQDELTSTLNELTQFELFSPRELPGQFFSRSRIIRLPQDSTMELRRLVINLTLDALDRWLNALPDSQVVEGRRGLRHVCMLDEAHLVLANRLPALGNLIRMSRSKGGMIMLISQSPDDFEGEDESFLDNMGLTVAFNTQAKPGPTRVIFGGGISLADLPVGEAFCRIRTEAKTRRIIAWRPESS